MKTARDLLMMTGTDAPEDLVDDLNEVIRRLDLVLNALPNFPVAAKDDLDVAWQVLFLGLPQAQIELGWNNRTYGNSTSHSCRYFYSNSGSDSC